MVDINPVSFDTQQPGGGLVDQRLQQLLASQNQAKTLSQALLQQATAQTPIYSTRAGLAKMLQGGLAGLSEGIDQRRAEAQERLKAQSRAAMIAGGVQPGANPEGFSNTPPADTDPTEQPAAPAAAPTSGPAPASGEDGDTPGPQASAVDPDAEGRFIGTLKAGGLTNPNGLAAVAAYANAESGYKPSNITGSWSDPSESGEPGTSGGILSWRGDRFANMRKATAGADDPVAAQAQFMLRENPELTAALQNAKSPDEAHSLMANAWQFAGYNRPGGESARRLDLTRQYLGKVGSAQTADAGDDATPDPRAAGQVADASGTATPSPSAVTGGGPQPDPQQLASALRAGPNGGVMSAPTNMGASTEMMPLEQGGGYAPVPPARPNPQQLAAMLQGQPQTDETGGTPLSAAAGKLAYAGGGPIMSDAPSPGAGPGLTAPPPGFQPQGPQDGPAPVKEAATRTLVGPSPVINDGQPVADAQANPATGKPTVLRPQGGPQGAPNAQPAPQGRPLAPQPSTPPAPPTQQQLTPRARAALGILSSSGFDATDKAMAQKIWEQETAPGHIAYDKAGNSFWIKPGAKPELIHDAEKADTQVWTDPNTQKSWLINKDNGKMVPIQGSPGSPGYRPVNAGAIPPFIPAVGPDGKPLLNADGSPKVTPNPDAVFTDPTGKPIQPFRDTSTKVTVPIDQRTESKGVGKAAELDAETVRKNMNEKAPALEEADRNFQMMQDAITRNGGKLPTGGELAKLGLDLSRVRQYLKDNWGLDTGNDPNQLQNLETFNKGGIRASGELARAIGGNRVLKVEMDLAQRAQPGIETSDFGNKFLIDNQRQTIKAQQDFYQAQEDYWRSHNHSLDGFQKAWNDEIKANPRFLSSYSVVPAVKQPDGSELVKLPSTGTGGYTWAQKLPGASEPVAITDKAQAKALDEQYPIASATVGPKGDTGPSADRVKQLQDRYGVH